MNKFVKIGAMLVVVVFLISWRNGGSQSNDPIEDKITAVMAKMTLEEKVGQMTQVTLDVVSKGKAFDLNKMQEIDQEKLETAILKYHVGSILNTGMYAMPKEQWRTIMQQIQDVATKKTKLKIPIIYGVDAIHGANYTTGATLLHYFNNRKVRSWCWSRCFLELLFKKKTWRLNISLPGASL